MNIVEVLKEYNIEFRREGENEHARRGWINIDCPICSPNMQRFRLGWNLYGKYFSCWNCGKVSTIGTLATILNLSYPKIKELLGELEQPDEFVPLKVKGILKLPSGLGPLRKAHIDYLKQRGFSNIAELIEHWRILGIDHRNPELAWRIFIPVYSNQEMVTWSTRTIGVSNPKRYITASAEQEKINIKQVLYGMDLVAHTIIVCEGPLDCWKIGPGAVALFGLQYSQAQLAAISKIPNRYICLDNEPAAQEVAQKLCGDLLAFPGTTKNIVLESAKDPGDCLPKELKQLKALLV